MIRQSSSGRGRAKFRFRQNNGVHQSSQDRRAQCPYTDGRADIVVGPSNDRLPRYFGPVVGVSFSFLQLPDLQSVLGGLIRLGIFRNQ